VRFHHLSDRQLEILVAQIDDLNAAVAKLQTDVNTLISATKMQDLSPTITAVNAIDSTVLTATPPPTTP
jgi:prefoldin subunit 5